MSYPVICSDLLRADSIQKIKLLVWMCLYNIDDYFVSIDFVWHVFYLIKCVTEIIYLGNKIEDIQNKYLIYCSFKLGLAPGTYFLTILYSINLPTLVYGRILIDLVISLSHYILMNLRVPTRTTRINSLFAIQLHLANYEPLPRLMSR